MTLFGTLSDGTPIHACELVNARGTSARIMTLGATLQSFRVADRDGVLGDIVLGHADPAPYRDMPSYFGSTIGRYANRIGGARFDLDGETYLLDANDGVNQLHGGASGFDQQVWEIVDAQQGSVTLRYVSADGEGGFPGELTATVTYRLDADDTLTIDHRATTTRPTVVNMTNHSYFNLGGAGDMLDHCLTVNATAFTPVDASLIPTGERRDVAGTPFDFREAHAIGARIGEDDPQLRIAGGYDHNFVLDGADGTLRHAARIEHDGSGRVLDLFTTAPGLQLYSGNGLDGSRIGKGDVAYHAHAGLCLEPQAFPDASNRADFPSARLDPGDTYRHTIQFRCSVKS